MSPVDVTDLDPESVLELLVTSSPDGLDGARSVAAALGRLVAEGRLAAGQRLPTVRATAAALGLSATTVTDAWQALVRSGVIETRGRAGSFVRGRGDEVVHRLWHVYPSADDRDVIDLSLGVPAPDLLPDLGRLLGRLSAGPDPMRSYLDAPVLDDLDHQLSRRWPFVPEAMTVVDGALDAVDRLLAQLLGPGATIVLEDPTFPPLFDLVETAGAEVIPVPVDANGIDPKGLAETMPSSPRSRAPSVVLIQPGIHNPTGAAMTPARAGELAQVLQAHPETIIIEDDQAWSDDPVSLGTHLPGRTVRIQSFSKVYGPELRLAAVGGAAGPIDALVRRRQLGAGWSSRLLQRLLVDMLADEDVTTMVGQAAKVYERRRQAMVDVLTRHGVGVVAGRGINLWVEVADERSALVALAAQGIVVAPGSPFAFDRLTNHIRVTVAGVEDDDLAWVAEAIAGAAG